MTPTQPGAIQVEDQLERRIRKPVDLLRCVLSCIEIVALAVAGVALSATTAGVETDIVDASDHLPHELRVVAPNLALLALFILPGALAVALPLERHAEVVMRQVVAGVWLRRLAVLRHSPVTISRAPPQLLNIPTLLPRKYLECAYGTNYACSGRSYFAACSSVPDYDVGG